jgi:hypothetical protein
MLTLAEPPLLVSVIVYLVRVESTVGVPERVPETPEFNPRMRVVSLVGTAAKGECLPVLPMERPVGRPGEMLVLTTVPPGDEDRTVNNNSQQSQQEQSVSHQCWWARPA